MTNKEIKDFFNSVKVKQKELAQEIGLNERSIRRMKKETPDKFYLLLDAVKYRKATGQFDIKIIKNDDKYIVYDKKEMILEFDNLNFLNLNDIEKTNLLRLKETSVRICVQDTIKEKTLFI